MNIEAFDFALPSELIAQHPATPRERARLLHLTGREIGLHRIGDLPELLRPGDHLVLNDTRVLPTRFFGNRGDVPVEATLVEADSEHRWWALARPGRRLRPGDRVGLAAGLDARVVEKRDDGFVLLEFELAGEALLGAIRRHGSMPLPPYIRRPRGGDPADRADYQTVFARRDGSVAAPTASLHLTEALLVRLAAAGIDHSLLTLHVGLGTFLPVKVDNIGEHRMHAEWWELGEATARRLNEARARGGRLVAVGTTALRTLETAADGGGTICAGTGRTDLFITPGYRFRTAPLLLTNFHLPRSTLFMLVAAFCGLERIREAYKLAIRERFRFFSYGDACLLERAP